VYPKESLPATVLLTAVAARLRDRRDELVEAQLVQLRRFGSYGPVPEADLRRSCARNVARVVATLEQRDSLPAEIEEDERASGQRRAVQGIPTDEVVKAYRAVISVLRDAFIEEASAAAADPWVVLAGTRTLWDLTDRYSDVLVAARQQVDIDTARRDEQHRIAFLHRLLTGSLDPAGLSAGGAVQGMLPDRDYWVVRGRHVLGDTQRLSRHLESCATSFRPLVAPFDNDVVGIAAARPVPLADAVIAVGGPARLGAVPHAFAEATQVLNVALRYGRTGVIDSSTLSVRVAVEQHDELGEQLYRRYLGPMTAHPGSVEILDTVQVYLRQHRSIGDTARALSVHPNTIRYRLARFHTLTGADLSSTDALVEVWWALEYASIRRPAVDAPSRLMPV
jgi:PucR-like helix-turn-helix protein